MVGAGCSGDRGEMDGDHARVWGTSSFLPCPPTSQLESLQSVRPRRTLDGVVCVLTSGVQV